MSDLQLAATYLRDFLATSAESGMHIEVQGLIGRLEERAQLEDDQRTEGLWPTTITFLTAEPVTADHLAQRITQAAGTSGALRPGEGCVQPSDPDTQILVGESSAWDQARADFLKHDPDPAHLPPFLQTDDEAAARGNA